MSEKKKKEKNEGTCVWIDEVGAIDIRVFKILGEKENQVKISFSNKESYIINKGFIRAKRVLIYQTADKKIHVQNPNKWKDIDIKKHGIKELRFNLQNFAIQEGKASIHRWTLPPDRLTKLSPLFKLLMICIAMGVMGWSALKFGTYVLDIVTKARLIDCNAILPKIQVPIGAVIDNVINATSPIGT